MSLLWRKKTLASLGSFFVFFIQNSITSFIYIRANFLNFSYIFNYHCYIIYDISNLAVLPTLLPYQSSRSRLRFRMLAWEIPCEWIGWSTHLMAYCTCLIIPDVRLVADITLTSHEAEKTCFWKAIAFALITCKTLLRSTYWERVDASHISFVVPILSCCSRHLCHQ